MEGSVSWLSAKMKTTLPEPGTVYVKSIATFTDLLCSQTRCADS